jgi:hypothetical protein
VPAKYSHLSANSSKRSKDGSRTKKAKAILAAKKSKKSKKKSGARGGPARDEAGEGDEERVSDGEDDEGSE